MSAQPATAQQPIGTRGDAPAPVSVDPQRLAAARVVIDHIFPLGTYAKVMSGSMNGMLDNMVASMDQIPLGAIAGATRQSPADVSKMGKTTLADIMAILDPYHEQRTTLAAHAMLAAIGKMMSGLEPSIREGLAQAYAHRFTTSQLADMNRFFDSPTGQAYAANAITIQTDPAVMARMQAIVPALMQNLPAIMSQAKDATAKLPPARKLADLSPAEKARLAGLLGIPESQMEANAAKK